MRHIADCMLRRVPAFSRSLTVCAVAPTCATGPWCLASQYASTTTGKCVNHPTCSEGQYLAVTSTTAAGICTDCSKTACASNQYRVGWCGVRTNGYECKEQPKCEDGATFLKGATPTARGTCATCKKCSTGQYRTGKCEGGVDGFECKTCSNNECKEANTFRQGMCGGTTDGYTCKACQNIQCGEDQVRSGTCSGTTNGFACKPCRNLSCKEGEYRSGTCPGQGMHLSPRRTLPSVYHYTSWAVATMRALGRYCWRGACPEGRVAPAWLE